MRNSSSNLKLNFNDIFRLELNEEVQKKVRGTSNVILNVESIERSSKIKKKKKNSSKS